MNLPVPTDDQRRSVLASRLKLRKALSYTLGQISDEDKLPPFLEIVNTILSNKHRDWLAQSHDDERLVSYARSRGVKFLPERRTKTTLARYIRRKWPDKDWIADADLECFCNRVMSLMFTDVSLFRMISGSDITRAYRDGVGCYSCMTGDDCHKVAIYEENPDVVQMLVFDDDSMTARALVWKTDQGKTCMDRIYPNAGRHIEIFNKHARDHGWLIRENNSAPNGGIDFVDEHGICTGEHTVSLDLPDPIIYPYMDSFRWVKSHDDGSVELSTRYADYRPCLSSTEGQGPGMEEDSVCCRDCNTRVDEGDSYSDDNGYYYCSDCYSERYGMCERCDCEVARDDLSTVHVSGRGERDWCSDCISIHAHDCDVCGETWRYDDLNEVDDEHYCNDCFNEHCDSCHECGETHHHDNMEQDEGGDWYCPGCLPEEVDDDADETADEEATPVAAAV